MPADNIWRCAGWVHQDGTVTFPEDCAFPAIISTSDYYVLIEHRNHLGILTPGYPNVGANMVCDGLSLQWDFTLQDSYKPAFRVGQKLLDGRWMMYAANGEQVVNAATIESGDRTLWRSQQNLLGYRKGDYNMNVSTGSEDESVWKGNQNKSSGIIFY
jgi:hypothetical protein